MLTDSLLMGEHRSRRVGQAVEFADYQPYQPGMDIRGLDWRVWARTDKWVTKRFETETQLPCTVVLDLSGDLGTGRSAAHGYPDLEGSKAGYAITLAATLLYFLHRHGEPVGLEIVAGEGMVHRSLPARTGRNHLQLLFLTLASARPSGVADLLPALSRVGARTRRRSWVGVITDGDLRRHMDGGILAMTASEVMTSNPKTVGDDALAAQVLAMMNENKITASFVVVENEPRGIVHIHDILRTGLS